MPGIRFGTDEMRDSMGDPAGLDLALSLLGFSG